jgi:co-chaperonin GroES (HSP10)
MNMKPMNEYILMKELPKKQQRTKGGLFYPNSGSSMNLPEVYQVIRIGSQVKQVYESDNILCHDLDCVPLDDKHFVIKESDVLGIMEK